MVAVKGGEHIYMLRAEACPLFFFFLKQCYLLLKTNALMVWMWPEYTAGTLPASPVLDSVVDLLSTMPADYSSWAGALLQNTSRPVV